MSRFRIGVVRVGDVKVGGVVRVGDVFDVLSVVITHLEVCVCCVSLFGFVSKVRLVDSARDTTKKGLDQLLSRPVNHVGRCHCRCYCYIVKVLVKDRARPPAVPPAIPPSSTPPKHSRSALFVETITSLVHFWPHRIEKCLILRECTTTSSKCLQFLFEDTEHNQLPST